MADAIISVLNPIKYVQENFTSSYNSRHIDDYHFEDTILPWEEEVGYAQPWQRGDTIHQQVILPYDTVTMEVFDKDGAIFHTEDFTQKLANLDDPTQKLFEHSYSLAFLEEGYYKLRLKCYLDGSTDPDLTLISNVLDIRNSHAQSVLLHYEHYAFREDVLFETGFHPSLRLLGTLKFDSPNSKRTVYEDQILNTTSLDAKRFRTWKLYCGSETGIPDYLIDKLEAILGCSDVQVDGRFYTVPEGGKLEPTEEEGYPMRGWAIELRETRQTSGTFSVTLPVVDTTAPYVLDAYVTDDARNRIVVKLNEPLAGYRIPDSELYPNLSHYSVWANVEGDTLYEFTDKDYAFGDVIYLTYSGGSIVDKAGNQMPYTENISVRNLINNPAATQFTAYWGWTTTKPILRLQSGDDTFITYQSGVFAVGAEVKADFHLMPEVDNYAVMKEPATEPVKTKWSDTGATYNNGTIPDSVFYEVFVVSGMRYYVTRNTMTFDPGINSRVIFSI